ncbi:hypothetical protein V8E51_005892 [Hyaloscypha variabilis]
MADQSTVFAFRTKQAFSMQEANDSQAARGWSAEDNAKWPIWSVNLGQLGWVRHQSHDMGTWANIRMLDRSGDGWIPRQCIEVGAPAGVQRLKVNIPFNSVPDLPVTDSTLLSRLLQVLFRDMNQYSDELCDAGARHTDIKNMSESPRVAELILKGMENVATRQLFDNGQPSWNSLWQLPAVQANDTGAGIYAILYWISLPNGQRDRHWYVGKSINIGQRCVSHRSKIIAASDPKTCKNHYRVARRAHGNGGWRFVKLAEAYIRLPPIFVESTAFGWSGEFAELGMAAASFHTAQTFGGFSTRVFKALGWTVANVGGLNWKTPLTETAQSYERVIWTGTYIPMSRIFEQGKTIMKSFRRSAMKISNRIGTIQDQNWMVVLQGSSQTNQYVPLRFGIDKEFAQRCGLELGMVVYPVVEIMLNGKAHATPYKRHAKLEFAVSF